MGGSTIYGLIADQGTPGVITRCTQEVDFASLDDAVLKRVLNAVKRGYTPHSGYVQSLVKLAAVRLGVEPPVAIEMGSSSWRLGPVVWFGKRQAPPEQALAELIRVATVRQKLWAADHPNGHGRNAVPEYTSSYYGGGPRLELVGFKGAGTEAAKQIMAIIREEIPGYFDEMQRLHDFIATKPRFVIERM